MKILMIILTFISTTLPAQNIFKTSVEGVVRGPQDGKLLLSEINSRIGDEQVIDFKNAKFLFNISSNEYLIYQLAFLSDVEDDAVWQSFEFIIEEGTLEIILDIDSIELQSSIIGGHQNALLIEFRKIYADILTRGQEPNTDRNELMLEFKDKVSNSISTNADEFISVYLIYRYHLLFEVKEVNYFLSIINDKYRSSKYYRKLRSEYLGKGKIAVGAKFIDFELPNKDNKLIKLSEIIRDNQVVLIEFWGSWCGPCIKKARLVKPIYEQFNNKGFEIIGVALETNKQRWLDMLTKENYRWPNVVELEQDQSQEIVIARLYQANTYPYGILVDQNGYIISINPSMDELSLILKEKFD
jgi:thiol-disulfide isomerase/thioredoxin